MADVVITTREGASASITLGSIDKFSERMRGDLIPRNHQAYDQARRVWNGHIDRRPALIARCLGVADVIASVNFAREHDLLVAVRSGAHNAAGYGTCEGGLVIEPCGAVCARLEVQAQRAFDRDFEEAELAVLEDARHDASFC